MPFWYVGPLGSDATGDGSLGNPYKELSVAHAAAGSGDTIYILPGINLMYVAVTVTKTLNIVGILDGKKLPVIIFTLSQSNLLYASNQPSINLFMDKIIVVLGDSHVVSLTNVNSFQMLRIGVLGATTAQVAHTSGAFLYTITEIATIDNCTFDYVSQGAYLGADAGVRIRGCAGRFVTMLTLASSDSLNSFLEYCLLGQTEGSWVSDVYSKASLTENYRVDTVTMLYNFSYARTNNMFFTTYAWRGYPNTTICYGGSVASGVAATAGADIYIGRTTAPAPAVNTAIYKHLYIGLTVRMRASDEGVDHYPFVSWKVGATWYTKNLSANAGYVYDKEAWSLDDIARSSYIKTIEHVDMSNEANWTGTAVDFRVGFFGDMASMGEGTVRAGLCIFIVPTINEIDDVFGLDAASSLIDRGYPGYCDEYLEDQAQFYGQGTQMSDSGYTGGGALLPLLGTPGAHRLEGWGRRGTYSLPVTLIHCSNYVTRVVVNFFPGMKEDFSDIRFTDYDGDTLLPHNLCSKTDGVQALFDVKDNFKPALGKVIYIYFSNASAEDASDPDHVYLLYDNFIGNNGDYVDSIKWANYTNATIQNNYACLLCTANYRFWSQARFPGPISVVMKVWDEVLEGYGATRYMGFGFLTYNIKFTHIRVRFTPFIRWSWDINADGVASIYNSWNVLEIQRITTKIGKCYTNGVLEATIELTTAIGDDYVFDVLFRCQI